MIPRNLAVVANGGPDSGSDLDANVGVNEKRVVSQVRSVEGSRCCAKQRSRYGEGKIRIFKFMLPRKL